jgi:hypothetical protein
MMDERETDADGTARRLAPVVASRRATRRAASLLSAAAALAARNGRFCGVTAILRRWSARGFGGASENCDINLSVVLREWWRYGGELDLAGERDVASVIYERWAGKKGVGRQAFRRCASRCLVRAMMHGQTCVYEGDVCCMKGVQCCQGMVIHCANTDCWWATAGFKNAVAPAQNVEFDIYYLTCFIIHNARCEFMLVVVDVKLADKTFTSPVANTLTHEQRV